jgi:hypothetical protein
MSEYELYEIVVGFTGNLEQSMAVLISLLSAYMIIAYSVGANLTKFQVLFISTCFTTVYIGVMQAQFFYLGETIYLAEKLNLLRDSPSAVEGTGDISAIIFISVRVLFLIGALYFMWNVRHPKTE